ncbi:MAG TPA: hypothetical protein VH539_06955 [Gemmatimonadaceae bacterium]
MIDHVPYSIEQHRQRHRELHDALDELLADFLRQHPRALPSTITVEQLLLWSYGQTQEPTDPDS